MAKRITHYRPKKGLRPIIREQGKGVDLIDSENRIVGLLHSRNSDKIPSWVKGGSMADMDFVNNRGYFEGPITPDEFFDVSRLGSCITDNGDGTANYITDNNLKLSKLGLSVERAFTEELLYTNAFDQWSNRGGPIISLQTELSPLNTIEATHIRLGKVAELDLYQSVGGGAPGEPYQPSFWVEKRPETVSRVFRATNTTGAGYGRWDISTDDLPVGWVKIDSESEYITEVFPFTVSPTGTQGLHFYSLTGDVDLNIFQANVVDGIDTQSSVQATSSKVILPSDNITRSTSGLFGVNEGMIRVEFHIKSFNNDGFKAVWHMDDGTLSNRMMLYRIVSNEWRIYLNISGSSATLNIPVGDLILDGKNVIAAGWYGAEFAVSANGNPIIKKPLPVGVAYTPEENFKLGSGHSFTDHLNDHIYRLTAYDTCNDILPQERSML